MAAAKEMLVTSPPAERVDWLHVAHASLPRRSAGLARQSRADMGGKSGGRDTTLMDGARS
jgi:hypothetical protein